MLNFIEWNYFFLEILIIRINWSEFNQIRNFRISVLVTFDSYQTIKVSFWSILSEHLSNSSLIGQQSLIEILTGNFK